jgi:uncharacterized membrane protein
MSTDLYYKFIKLVSGESIICATDNNCLFWYDDKVISILNPVVVTSARYPRGDVLVESYILYSWSTFAKDDVIDLPTSKILVVLNPMDGLIKNYEDFIMRRQNEDIEIDTESNEDIEEEILQEIMETLQEGTDSYEENETGEESSSRDRGTSRILH